MATSPIGSASSAGSAASALSSALGANGNTLDQNSFLNLLVTQLRYQNPLDPMSDADFASQLAQFSTLQGVQQMNSSLNNLVLMQQMSQGANLIGKSVIYMQSDGKTQARGTVAGVSIDATGNVQLAVNGNMVPVSQVRGILGNN